MTEQHGGYREGAGRKPSGKRKAVFYVTESEEGMLRCELEQLRKGEPKIMTMECCGRMQAWGAGAEGEPVVGQEAFCVWCQRTAKITKVY